MTALRIVAVLALVQALFGILRALEVIRIGSDLSGRGVLLLPILASVVIARGLLVGVIAVLYAVFAWGAFRQKSWAWPVGMVAALVNLLAVVPLLFGDAGPIRALAWAIVPVIVIVYLLAPGGRRALSG